MVPWTSRPQRQQLYITYKVITRQLVRQCNSALSAIEMNLSISDVPSADHAIRNGTMQRGYQHTMERVVFALVIDAHKRNGVVLSLFVM